MSNPKKILVSSSADFKEEGNLLLLGNISDKNNNILKDTTIYFDYYEISIPKEGDIVINEIMADPTPPIDLPEAEFIELWNTSEKHFDLAGFQINGKAISKNPYLLKKNSFIILCKYTDILLFEDYANVVGMDSWDILSNAGDNVTLTNDDVVIDEVNYTIDWYGSNLKSKGGFTLERKYITYPCDQQFNWEASISESGGSPGYINSVSNKPPDIVGPRIEEAFALNSTSIEVIFDKPINPSSFQITDVYSENIVFIGHSYEDGESIILNVLKPLEVNKIYEIAFKEISDCAGNQMADQNVTVVLPDVIEPGDILLNEILFDPYPSGVDYLEIYNATNKYLDIQSVMVSSDTVSFYKISNRPYILVPNQYLALTTDTNRVINDYPQTREILNVSALPGMPNDGGELFLFKGTDTLDYIQYSLDMHIKFLQNTEGVSLERISANSRTNDPDNWHSAASSAGFGTPGFVNSQAAATMENEKSIFLSHGFITPNQDGDKDFLEINYIFDHPGFIATISIYSSRGEKIKALTNNLILAQRGHIKWDGDNDAGEILKTGHYIIVAQVYNTTGESYVYKEKVVILK